MNKEIQRYLVYGYDELHTVSSFLTAGKKIPENFGLNANGKEKKLTVVLS